MSNSNETVARRDLLLSAAAAAALGPLSAQAAQHVHAEAEEHKKTAPAGVYKPKLFNAHEYKTLQRLAVLIIPSEHGGPSALDAGAPEFVDLLASVNDTIQGVFLGGLAWLDGASMRRTGKKFIDTTPEQQTALLDLIAYRKSDSPEFGPGIRFFSWARRMVVDAYYTSPHGIKELGFKGNKGMSTFQIPKEALEWVERRTPPGLA